MPERERERGSAAVEAAIIVPALLVFAMLVVAFGRIALARQAIAAAAFDAARAASISRTVGEATSAATAAAQVTLANRGVVCAPQISVNAAVFGLPVGATGQVRVDLTCVVSLGDLTIPGIPGTITVTTTGLSALDAFREHG